MQRVVDYVAADIGVRVVGHDLGAECHLSPVEIALHRYLLLGVHR